MLSNLYLTWLVILKSEGLVAYCRLYVNDERGCDIKVRENYDSLMQIYILIYDHLKKNIYSKFNVPGFLKYNKILYFVENEMIRCIGSPN